MAHGVAQPRLRPSVGPARRRQGFRRGMLMGMARRPLGNGTVQFKAMLSPDPLMGPRGYPLLLASGETANGRDRLIDRQHPHDLFMELSARSRRTSGRRAASSSTPACRASRRSARPPSCTANRSWICPRRRSATIGSNSTHISFGVLTAGVVLDRVKLEVSRFNGREPDQHRWNIETGPLDSTADPRVVEPGADARAAGRAGAISTIPSSSSRESTRSAGRRARSTPARLRPAGSSPARSPGAARRRAATRTTRSSPKPR